MENPMTRAITEARKAEAASSPGKDELMGKQEDIEKGVTEHFTPTQLKEAGWSWLYHVATGLPSLCNNNWLAIKLSHTDSNGNYIWTAEKPAKPPWQGTFKCKLHPDNEHRAKYDEMGFSVCMKSNMPNEYQQRNHMRKRHKAEWAIIQEMEADRKEAIKEDKDRAMMEALTGRKVESVGTPEAPLYVSDKPKKK